MNKQIWVKKEIKKKVNGIKKKMKASRKGRKKKRSKKPLLKIDAVKSALHERINVCINERMNEKSWWS